jgi:hypothetical protein
VDLSEVAESQGIVYQKVGGVVSDIVVCCIVMYLTASGCVVVIGIEVFVSIVADEVSMVEANRRDDCSVVVEAVLAVRPVTGGSRRYGGNQRVVVEVGIEVLDYIPGGMLVDPDMVVMPECDENILAGSIYHCSSPAGTNLGQRSYVVVA